MNAFPGSTSLGECLDKRPVEALDRAGSALAFTNYSSGGQPRLFQLRKEPAEGLELSLVPASMSDTLAAYGYDSYGGGNYCRDQPRDL